MSEQPRPAVIAAGAELIKAACAYVDAREAQVSTLELVPIYRRLESAVIMFHEVTDDE
jgi:hypothetical protein